MPNKETLTVAGVLRLRPCGGYTKDRIKELWGGKRRLSLLEICDLDIPIKDRLWAILRAVDRQTRCILAVDFAGHVLPRFEHRYPNDKRPRTCLEVIHQCLDGSATKKDLKIAAAAAYDAYDAAADAAAAAAYTAAYTAADDAAAAAADAAARERKWQLDRVRFILRCPLDSF